MEEIKKHEFFGYLLFCTEKFDGYAPYVQSFWDIANNTGEAHFCMTGKKADMVVNSKAGESKEHFEKKIGKWFREAVEDLFGSSHRAVKNVLARLHQEADDYVAREDPEEEMSDEYGLDFSRPAGKA